MTNNKRKPTKRFTRAQVVHAASRGVFHPRGIPGPDDTSLVETKHVLIRDMDIELWRRAKGKAALQGVTLREAIVSALQQWVAQ